MVAEEGWEDVFDAPALGRAEEGPLVRAESCDLCCMYDEEVPFVFVEVEILGMGCLSAELMPLVFDADVMVAFLMAAEEVAVAEGASPEVECDHQESAPRRMQESGLTRHG